MKKLITLLLVLFASSSMLIAQQGGSITSEPGGDKINPDAAFTLTYDGTGTNFANWEPRSHAHLWLMPKEGEEFAEGHYGTEWINYAGAGGDDAWALVPDKQKMELQSTGIYTITIDDLYEYFGVTEEDKAKIGQLGMIVRAEYDGASNQTIDLFIAVGDYEVPDVPTEDIVVSVKIPEGWVNPHVFSWGTSSDGFNQLTEDGEWYRYTFVEEQSVNFVFVNGDDWSGDNNQTVDVSGITESTCFVIGDEEEGKRSVETVDCGDLPTSVTHLDVRSNISLNGRQLHYAGDGMLRIFAISGQMLHAEEVKGNFTRTMEQGVYIVTIDNKAEKLIVR